ncbi:hypothetical protein GCM10027299_58220 [Larkinella ripae]
MLAVAQLNRPVAAQQTNRTAPERILCNRLHYLVALKKRVAQNHWPAYGKRAIENEVRFYTDQGIYLVHPQKQTLSETRTEACACPGFVLFRVSDSLNTSYQMFTNFADGIAACNDVTVSRQYIPDVPDTESWAIMVIHEMFHQYQTSHRAFQQRAVDMTAVGCTCRPTAFGRFTTHFRISKKPSMRKTTCCWPACKPTEKPPLIRC